MLKKLRHITIVSLATQNKVWVTGKSLYKTVQKSFMVIYFFFLWNISVHSLLYTASKTWHQKRARAWGKNDWNFFATSSDLYFSDFQYSFLGFDNWGHLRWSVNGKVRSEKPTAWSRLGSWSWHSWRTGRRRRFLPRKLVRKILLMHIQK